MKKVIKNKMSIEDLALSMGKGFKRVEKLIEAKIDGLAVSTAKGFEGVDKRFNEVDKRFESLEAKMKTDVESINKRIDDFAETKVSKIVYKELENRVQKIESKI